MEGRIAKLRDHIVVCGGGQTGRHIAGELLGTRTPFVCIELNPAEEDAIRKLSPDILYMLGDATDSEVLRAARVEVARGLIACMPSDKDNLFTLLTARELNPSMRIVSRLIADESRPQLIRAGADVVVSVPTIGALRLASEMLRPHVVGFLDSMLREPGAVRVQEIPIGHPAIGQRLGSLRLQERVGMVVFALRDGVSHRYRYNPPPDHVLAEGDVLIACADPEQVAAARKLVTADR
jgi:voltage-gated potassium channel